MDDGGVTPSWLAGSEFHDDGVRAERRGETVVWAREREERVFDAADGMPRSWSIVGDVARLQGRSVPPARPFDDWQRGLDATDGLWAASPHQAAWLDWSRQFKALALVQSANLRLAVEADWIERRASVARGVATAYCATDAIRKQTRAAAGAAAGASPTSATLTEATLQTAVESILGDVVAPDFVPEKPPPGAELLPFPDDESLRELRGELLAAIRAALRDQIRAAWPK
jgi:hypothetical protein